MKRILGSLVFWTALVLITGTVSAPAAPSPLPPGKLVLFTAPGDSAAAPVLVVTPRDSNVAGVMIPDERGGHVLMPTFEVRASILHPRPQADAEELRITALEAHDPASVADLAPLVPNTRASMNSRGETVLMVRGAPERQVVIQQDGIPLTLPWDERSDLSLLPAQAIGEARITRGAGSVLSGPNAVAGFVELRTRERKEPGYEADLRVSRGEVERTRVAGLLDVSGQRWEGLAAFSFHRFAGFLLPDGYSADFNQNPNRWTRANSDGRQTSGLLKGVHRWKNGSRIALSFQGYDARRGVPPEDNLSDARFWRYPQIQRGIAGLELQLRPDGGRLWQIDTNLSFDRFHQEIRQYDNAVYDSPLLLPGIDYETDDDRTGFARAQVRRVFDGRDTISLALSSRSTRHQESLVANGPVENYSEWLSGVAVEWERRDQGHYGLRLGAGIDLASTPETGGKPSRDSQTSPSLSARGTREFSGRGEVYLQLARRSRFPSLRELYSGALGRFVPNLDLKPEDQSSVELGGSVQGRRWSLSSAVFGYWTLDGIVKKSLPDRQFQRVNEEEIRVLGLELRGSWRPRPGLRLEAHHSFLHARAKEDGGFQAKVEDRPQFLSYLDLSQRWRWGGRLGLEMVATGAQWSQDLAAGGLVRLPSQIQWNLRASWELVSRSSWFGASEFYLRVDNFLDAQLYNQAGLPQAGRQLRVGIDTRLGT